MKKNTMIYIIITILACALTGTITYMFVNNKDNKSEIKENKNNSNHQNNNEENNSNQNNKEEVITLNEKELEEYLNYIPIDISGGVYKKGYSNIQNIDKYLLLEHLVTNIINKENYNFKNNKTIKHNFEIICNEDSTYFIDYCPEEKDALDTFLTTESYISLNYINSKSKKMYNKELTGFQNTKPSDKAITIGGLLYYYYNDNFIQYSGGNDDISIVHLIDKYNATDKELNIYEYVAKSTSEYDIENIQALEDIDSGYSINIDNKNVNLQQILKENKNKFTKYKHIFKKGVNGYYWYSTEIVK